MTSRSVLILFALAVLLNASADATTITVDMAGSGDFVVIDDALSAAAVGDTVLVLPGYYNRSLLVDKALTLRSSAGSVVTTIAGPSSNVESVHVTADGVVFEGFTITAGRRGLDVDAGVTDFAVSDITIEETGAIPVRLPVNLIPEIVPQLNLVMHFSNVFDAVGVHTGTITSSTTWPVLPAGFVYFLDWATVTIADSSGPVLTIPSGEIIKMTYSRFEVGSNTQSGGLVADSVIFTSIADDIGGNTNGSTYAPGPGDWQRLDFNAMARADSCLITNCEFRYGGNGAGVVQVAGSDPTVSGCTFSENTCSLYIESSPTFGANLAGNTLNQGNWRPIHTPLDCIDNVVFGNTIVPRVDGMWNGIDIASSTITESWTLPTLPHGFLYYFNWATITVKGPSGPVLTIPSGEILKMTFSRFEIGSNTEAGGLVADGVIFTSVNDDAGGDTNGSTAAPGTGNWQRLDFNAMARADSCLITDCTFRYGGNGVGVVQVAGSDPTVSGCTFSENTCSLYIESSPTFGANLAGNTLNQGNWRPIHTPLDCIDNVVFGNTIVPRVDGKWNGIDIPSSTVSESWSLPTLPHAFLYYFNWATITVKGPSGPVLTIPNGEIIKMTYSRFEIGSNTEPGGLVADGVTFTSINDDTGGDTNGGTGAPGPGNWQRLDFNAMARADSCLITNCEIRYGGNGVGVVQVAGSDPTIAGCTFTDNSCSFYIDASPTFGVNLMGNTINQGDWRPIHAPLDCIDNVVFGNTIVPRGDGKWNGIDIPSSTISESWTLPVLPHGFLYYLNWAAITVKGPSGPVLTIPNGEIIKMTYSRFEIGSNTEPGGLVADGVTFTSINDDTGGDTNGGTGAPGPGNWQRLDFNAMARADSCLITDCTFRYGGNGGSTVEVVDSSPRFERCDFSLSSTAGAYVHGAAADPTFWYSSFTDNTQYGIRTTSGQAHVIHSCFEGNGLNGVLVVETNAPTGTLLMTNCWWGAADGPSGEGTGSGDAVSAGVTYEPWALTPACADLPTGTGDDAPAVLTVRPAYPNPFNPSTTISFELPATAPVRLSVVDLQGRRVATLASGELPAGRHDLRWTGRDDRGRHAPAGVYMFRLETGGEVRTGKLVMLK